MRDAGVLLNGVDIGCSSDGSASVDTSSYRGVVALRDLDCGEVIVELPTDAVIAHSARMGGGGAMTPSLKAWMRSSMRMRLPRIRREMLVREMALRLISTPRAGLQYIDSYLLNESNVSRLVCGHPVFWSTAERDAVLGGTSVNVILSRSTISRTSIFLPPDAWQSHVHRVAQLSLERWRHRAAAVESCGVGNDGIRRQFHNHLTAVEIAEGDDAAIAARIVTFTSIAAAADMDAVEKHACIAHPRSQTCCVR